MKDDPLFNRRDLAVLLLLALLVFVGFNWALTPANNDQTHVAIRRQAR